MGNANYLLEIGIKYLFYIKISKIILNKWKKVEKKMNLKDVK